MIDWVPCQDYDTAIALASDSQLDFPLLNREAWSSDIEIIGDIEGEDDGYKILRIVGYWAVTQQPATGAPAQGTVYARLWPGFQNQQDQVVEVPGILSVEYSGATSADAGRAANEKWWWERLVDNSDVSPVLNRWLCASRVNHPFSYFCDVKPNYWCSKSEVPVLSVLNATDEDLYLWHRLRMLVAKKG